MGGPLFMSALTILLIIVTAWIIYHFIAASGSGKRNKKDILRKLGYGKTMGLFAFITGILGQLIGFTAMFLAIEEAVSRGEEIRTELVFEGIRVTMIVSIYGIFIYLFSLIVWFFATLIIEKRKQV